MFFTNLAMLEKNFRLMIFLFELGKALKGFHLLNDGQSPSKKEIN